MNCHEAEPLLQAERDGALSTEQRARLAAHVSGCAACREFQSALGAAMSALHTDIARVPMPDPDEEWRLLQLERRALLRQPRTAGPAPVLWRWFAAPLTAVAALALAFYAGRTMPIHAPAGDFAVPAEASADFVEVADADATPIVYLDQESGWLVVWAADNSAGDGRTSASM